MFPLLIHHPFIWVSHMLSKTIDLLFNLVACDRLGLLILHVDSNVISHVLLNVSQEQTANDGNTTECNRDVVNVRVGCRVRLLTRLDQVRVVGSGDTRQQSDLVEQTGASELDNGGDFWGAGDAEDVGSAADDCDGVLGELLDEDIVVDCVADGTSQDTDTEGEGGDGGDEVVGTDDGCDDGGGDDDTTNTETRDDEEERSEPVAVFESKSSHTTTTWSMLAISKPRRTIGK